MKTFKIKWDAQEKGDEGWAYYIDGGESGPIYGAAAKVVDRMIIGLRPSPDYMDILRDEIGASPDDKIVFPEVDR